MFGQINSALFVFLNNFAGSNPVLDAAAVLIAEYLPFVFIAVLLYLWFQKSEYKNIALYAGYSAVLGIFLNLLIGLFYFHPRPFMENLGTALIRHIPQTSFPSDHATFMLAIAFMLLWFKQARRTGLILAALGFLGGIARVFCGLHFPFDIAGSLLAAGFSSGAVFLLKNRLRKANNFIINSYYRITGYED